jgi:hypothetical protein
MSHSVIGMTFIEHNPTGTWRGSPFLDRHWYRIRANAPSYDGQIEIGEVLKYFGAYYGQYYGETIYAFVNLAGQERTWRVGDDEPIDNWETIFEPLDEVR